MSALPCPSCKQYPRSGWRRDMVTDEAVEAARQALSYDGLMPTSEFVKAALIAAMDVMMPLPDAPEIEGG